MVTSADIVNQALQQTGGYNNAGAVTGSPPTFDDTPAGLAAGIIYNPVVQYIARQFGWDFSRSVTALEVTGNAGELGFALEYIFPTDAVQLRQVLPPQADIDPNNPLPVRWTVGNAIGGAVAATGYIHFAANPSNGQTITLNGRAFTFVTSGGWPSVQTNYQINIGGNLGGTLFFLEQALTSGATYLADSALNVATYAAPSSDLDITYIVPGEEGNDYTLAASNATPSGATLTGGVTTLQKVIWTDQEDAEAVITNQPPENTWDAAFTQAVVKMLASILNMALASKPESSKMEFDQAMLMQKAGELRTDT